MALLFYDPFIHYNNDTDMTTVGGWSAYSGGYNGTDGPYGLGRLRLGGYDNGGEGTLDSFNFRRALPEATGSAVWQQHIRNRLQSSGADTRFLSLHNNAGADKCLELKITANGAIKVYDADGTLVATTATGLATYDTWVPIGVVASIGSASGVLKVWVDQDATETPVVNLTGVNLTGGDSGGCDYVWLRGGGNGVGLFETQLDHALGFYGDSSGTTFNTYMGPRCWSVLSPTGAGSNSDFLPSAGSNYACVDDTPTAGSDGDSTYVEQPDTAGVDTYAMADSTASLHGVIFAGVQIGARVEPAGTHAEFKMRIRSSGGSTTDSAAQTISSWVLLRHGDTDVPGGSGWTKADVDGLQVGYTSAGGVTPKVRVTVTSLIVYAYPDDYTAPEVATGPVYVPLFPGVVMQNDANTTVRAATPVRGVGQWHSWANMAMWLVGRGAQLLSLGPQMEMGLSATGFSCFVYPHRQIRNWLWILTIARRSDAGHVYGRLLGAQGTSLGEWQLDSAIRKYTPQTFYFVESFDNAVDAEYAITPVVYIDSTPDEATLADCYMLGLQAVELPMQRVSEFGSAQTPVVNPVTCASRAPIYRPTSGYKSVNGLLRIGCDLGAGTGLAREARRPFLFNWAHPTGVEITDSAFSGSSQLFAVAPSVVPRHLYSGTNTSSVRCKVRAACVGGALTGEVKLTATTGDTVTISISGGTLTWYEDDLTVETEDLSRNATDGGIRGGSRDFIIVEGRVTGGTTSLVVVAFAICEAE